MRESVWHVTTTETRFIVDEATAQMIEGDIITRKTTSRFTDTFGGRAVVVVKAITSIYESTPECREAEWAYDLQFNLDAERHRRQWREEHGLVFGDE